MKKYRSYLWILIAVLAMGLAVSACNKGGNDNNDSGFQPSPIPSDTVGSAPAPAPAPAPPAAVGGRDGVKVEMLSTDFAAGRCTNLSLPEFQGRTIFIEVARVTNNTKLEGYDKTALYQTRRATCDAHADNPAGPAVTDPMVTGGNIPAGESREWTHTLEIPRNFCGSLQFDNDFRNGEVAVSSMSGGGGGRVINSGRDCLDCEFFGLDVLVSGEGLTRNVTVNFTHPKANKKATVNFGDGSPVVEFARGETKSHTWPFGDFTITATVADPDQDEECEDTAMVTNRDDPSCKDINVQFSRTDPVEAATVTRSIDTYLACFQGSWVSPPPTGSLNYGDGSPAEAVPNPFGPTCHHYAQTGDPQTFTATLMVVREDLRCPASLEVKVPPRECIPEWKVIEEGTREGDWGECQPTNGLHASTGAPAPECRQYRTMIDYVIEQNTCTKETRERIVGEWQESEPCDCPGECQVQVDPGIYCFDGPLGNGVAECSNFGLTYQDKDDELSGLTHTASQSAEAAIVKDGAPHCYNVYSPVTAGQTLATPNTGKDISHVTYCGCPAVPAFQSAVPLTFTDIN